MPPATGIRRKKSDGPVRTSLVVSTSAVTKPSSSRRSQGIPAAGAGHADEGGKPDGGPWDMIGGVYGATLSPSRDRATAPSPHGLRDLPAPARPLPQAPRSPLPSSPTHPP